MADKRFRRLLIVGIVLKWELLSYDEKRGLTIKVEKEGTILFWGLLFLMEFAGI